MLNEIASNTPFFGMFLCAVSYLFALKLREKTKLSVLNPLIVSCAAIIILLLVTDTDPQAFTDGRLLADGTRDGTGAKFFQIMLTPTTVCLAIPLYEKLSYLRKYPFAIIGGIMSGAITSLGSVYAISRIFGLSKEQYATLLPKSITTAIGMGVSEELGGIVPVTVAVIILTGIFGNMITGFTMKVFSVKHPVAVGLACGTAAHAIGTSRAREFGEVEEAMSGLSIAICGIITVILASFMVLLPI